MYDEILLNETIDELTKIKSAMILIKKEYQSVVENTKLKDTQLKKSVKKMIDILDKIYQEVFKNSEKLKLLNLYGEYYLPTIAKMIQRYQNLSEKEVKTENVQNTLNHIEETFEKLVEHFKNKYVSLFEDELIDLNAEIKVLMHELGNK